MVRRQPIRPEQTRAGGRMIEVSERSPSPEEYNALRRVAGWNTYDVAAARRGLAASLFTVCVRDDGELIAFGRVVGDGAMTFYIQDVIVAPERRGEGHARMVMERVMHYILSVATPGSVVGLMAARGVEGLYEKYGFVSRPRGHMGAGMVLVGL
jgi:GNAT superfamily N-acetyltransferase